MTRTVPSKKQKPRQLDLFAAIECPAPATSLHGAAVQVPPGPRDDVPPLLAWLAQAAE
jgi:hypothetical protein